MIGPARHSGLFILIVIAVLYYSGAGNWMLARLKGLDSNCYSGLAQLGAQVTNPICSMVAKASAGIAEFGDSVGQRLERMQQSIFGGNGVDKIRLLAGSLGGEVTALASSGNALAALMRAGPSSLANAGQQSFQQAIDSFAIGQGFLRGGGAAQALPWLQQGALQPQGFGVMSQLTLGSLYANGGQGIAANPQHAEYYLSQARQSIAMLSGNNSPQAQQLLHSLPGSPQKIQADLERAIIEIRALKR